MKIPNFNQNFQTFILGNNIGYQTAADLINREMAKLDEKNQRIYMANDVWTIVGRGSTPRNHLVMVAIANIIGKSLEDLIVNLYDMSELRRVESTRPVRNAEPQNDIYAMRSESCMMVWDESMASRSCRIAKLFDEMGPENKTLVLDLASNIEMEGKVTYLSLLVETDMPLDDDVNILVHYNNENGRPESVPVYWCDFAERLQECDSDPSATIARFVHDRFLCCFENDLHVDVTPCDVSRYYDEDENGYELANGYLIKMRLGLTRRDVIFLYEQSLQHLKQRLAKLEKERENNKKED